MLKEAHVQAWIVVQALMNGYGRAQPGCRDDLLAFLFQLSYCKVCVCVLCDCGERPLVPTMAECIDSISIGRLRSIF